MAVLGTVAAIMGIVGAATAVGSAAYSLSQPPANLNQGNAQAEGVQAAADVLPTQRLYQAAAQQGGTAIRYGYAQQTADQYRAALQNYLEHPPASATSNPYWNTQAQTLRQQLANAPTGNQPVYYNTITGALAPKETAVVDFHGLGTADVQSKLAQEMAGVQLQLQQRYGTQFAQQAKNELALSDPLGTQARSELYNLTNEQANKPFDQPVSDILDRQVGEQLAAGSDLTAAQRSLLDSEVAKAQAARGQDAGADTQQFATPLTTGYEGMQRQLAGQQKATGWLASGATPEDVQYRHQQQNLSNLGAFVGGRTPESQFSNMSAAQQGSTPFVPGQQLAQMNNNAGQTAQGYTTAGYLQNLQYQQHQANSWMGGLSSLLNLGGALNNAGAFGSGGSGTGP